LTKFLVINTDGETTFNAAVGSTDELSSLTVQGVTTLNDGNTVINATTINTTGDQTYNNPVTLLSDTTLNSSTSGSVTFNSTVDTDPAATGLRALTINSDGVTTFKAAVGDTRELSSLTVQGFLVGSQELGNTVINAGSINTTGDQTYNNPVTLLSDTTLNSSASGAVTFNSTVDTDSSATALRALTINSDGVTTFNAAVGATRELSSLTIQGFLVGSPELGNTVINAGSINTTGDQTYNNPVILLSDTTLNSSASGAVTFNSMVDTDPAATALRALTINSDGVTTFNSAVGATRELSSLTVQGFTNPDDGNTVINAGSINTTGAQTYNNPATLLSDTTINSSDVGAVTFNTTVTGNTTDRRLFINVKDRVVFNDLIQVGHLEIGQDGTSYLNSNSVVTTSGSSMLFGNDVVVSASDITFDATAAGTLATGANITFNKSLSSAIAGGTTVIFNAGTAGVVTLLGTVGKDANGVVKPLNVLSVTAGGGIVISGGYVHSTGEQTYNNPVTLGASVSFLANKLNLGTVTASAPNVGLSIVSQGSQLLNDITITGDLEVTTGVGGLIGGVTQAAGTALNIGGASTFTADTTQGQIATLTIAVNNFVGAMYFKEMNGGTWGTAEVVSASALRMGETTITGDLSLKTVSVDITQVGPMTVGGRADIVAAGSVKLADVGNNFVGKVNVNTGGALELTTSGALTIGKVVTANSTVLKSTGKIDLGTSVFGGTLKVNSGGFEIMQSGPGSFGGNTDFDAGTAKIDLFNPKNFWKGSIVYKGGIVMINHPQLLNATNAGTLIVRVETTMQTTSIVKVAAPATAQPASESVQPSNSKGTDVSVSQQRAATPQQSGLVTVTVSAEAAASGKGFAFSLDEHLPAEVAKSAQVRVSQLDGKPLPEWLRYEPSTQKVLAVSPPAGAFPIQIKASVGGVETVIVITEQPK
jgi:hypothetical protein